MWCARRKPRLRRVMDLEPQEAVAAVMDDPHVAAEAQAAGWTPPGHDGGGSYQGLAAKLVNLRGVGRPPDSSGNENEWSDFKFKMESVCALLGVDVVMEGPEHILTPEEMVKGQVPLQHLGTGVPRKGTPDHQAGVEGRWSGSLASAQGGVRARCGVPPLCSLVRIDC